MEYNVVTQVLRYMVFIWEDYEKQQEELHKDISKTAGFKYPPVLPVVYYTGKDIPENEIFDFTDNIKERNMSDLFAHIKPDEEYAEMRQEIKELSALRDDLSGEINSLSARNSSLKTENGSLKTENGSLKTENGSLKTENGSLKTEIDTLTKQHSEDQAEITRLRTQLEHRFLFRFSRHTQKSIK